MITKMPIRCPDKPNRLPQDQLPLLDQLGGYIATAKYDGWRAVIDWDGEEVEVYSRRGMDKGGPTILALSDPVKQALLSFLRLNQVKPNSRFDGEWLSQRHTGEESIVLFGPQYLNSQWVGGNSEQSRWDHITSLVYPPGPIIRAEAVDRGYLDFFNTLKRRDSAKPEAEQLYEGIVLKHASSVLIGDRKTSQKNPMWFKAKWRDSASGHNWDTF